MIVIFHYGEKNLDEVAFKFQLKISCPKRKCIKNSNATSLKIFGPLVESYAVFAGIFLSFLFQL